MKVINPTRLLLEAADVLGPFRDELIVVGAAALEVALAEASGTSITPTRDVDAVVPVSRVDDVVAHLEGAKLTRSEVPHERAFTWVRGDLKVQLVRTYHPFPKGAAEPLPANPVFGMAADPAHHETVAFMVDPTTSRLKCANAACLLALKEAAFGRKRPGSGAPVERDFHDAYLVISEVPETLLVELGVAGYEVRARAARAVSLLAEGNEATIAAARQMVRLRTADTQRAAEAAVRRDAARLQKRLSEASLD